MIAIVDYGAGNLTSVRLALESLGTPGHVTRSPRELAAAERVIFPGVGAAGAAMRHLNELGLAGAIRAAVRAGKPFLGICVGTQVLLDRSDEDGGVDTLGLVPGAVKRFAPGSRYDKVPQMGWNSVRLRREHPVLNGIRDGSEFYFVHSYYPAPAAPDCVLGETDYAGISFASLLQQGSLVATQFHPEKSGRVGLRLLRNFLRWDGSGRGEGYAAC